MSDFYTDLKSIISSLENILDKHEFELKQSNTDGYDIGFKHGLAKGFEVGASNLSVDGLDWNSIKIFSAFCYINGIDFSYMGKTPGSSFIDRVLDRFKASVESDNDVSTSEYRKYISNKSEICKCKYCGNIPKLSSWEDTENIIDYYFIQCNNDECESDITTKCYDITDENARNLCISEWNNANTDKHVSINSFDDVITCSPKLKVGEFIQLFLLGDDDKIYINLYDHNENVLLTNTRIISDTLKPYYDKYIAWFTDEFENNMGLVLEQE